MERLGWAVDGRAWVWRRRLFVWEEEMVRECFVLLHNFILQENVYDTWRWLLDPGHDYTVQGSYNYLSNTDDIVDRSTIDDVWHKQIPSKVSLMVWRLLRNRLLTKDNLSRRGILASTDLACAAGCDSTETATHLFLHCTLATNLWFKVWNWLGISSVLSGDLRLHFIQFTKMVAMPHFSHYFLHII